MPPKRDDEGTAKTFSLFHPAQMLAKLAWEQRLASDVSAPQVERLFAVLNAFATAWHMIEWTWEFMGPSSRNRRAALTQADYRKHLVVRCPDLTLCQQIGNGGKHRRLTKWNDPTIRTGIRLTLRLRSTARARVEPVSFTGTLQINHGIVSRDALEVIGTVLDFWRSELADLEGAGD